MRDPAHYLKALKTTRTPKRLVWVDCDATPRKERGVDVERWHVGAIGTTHYTSRKLERMDTMKTERDAYHLWAWVDEFCTPNRRVTLMAYDLAYQLRISEGLVHLPALGWELDRIVLEKTAAWALFRDGKRSLMMCDLKSWMPVPFNHIAHGAGHTAWEGRSVEAGPDFRRKVCAWRATVVRDATLQILEWIQRENLGGFKPTGSGQSYGAYRRRFLHHHLLVHDDESRLAAERRAMWTGRCEAWQHGTLRDGPYAEYDMQAAYCHIAAECDVPTVALNSNAGTTPAALERAMQTYAIMADVTITTDVPCVPTRVGTRTVWPVGTFRTTLWDPELRLAMQYAREFKCHRAYRYQRAPALQQFGQYVLDALDPHTPTHGPLPSLVLKHWSRCLVGRLGLKFRTWEEFGRQDEPDLRLVTFADWEDGTQTDMLIAGCKRMILTDMREATESLPQIPGWIMSECRARLWRAMVWVGFDHLVYCDTDSIIFHPGTHKDTRYHYEQALPGDWTTKGTYGRMTINGPRNLVAQSTRRVSGLPLTARQTAPTEFTGEVMRSIKESMRAGELDSVAHIPRTFLLDAPDLRRQHLPYGATAPFRINQPTQEADA